MNPKHNMTPEEWKKLTGGGRHVVKRASNEAARNKRVLKKGVGARQVRKLDKAERRLTKAQP